MKCEYPGCEKKAVGVVRRCKTKVCWEHRGWTKGFIVKAEDFNELVRENITIRKEA